MPLLPPVLAETATGTGAAKALASGEARFASCLPAMGDQPARESLP